MRQSGAKTRRADGYIASQQVHLFIRRVFAVCAGDHSVRSPPPCPLCPPRHRPVTEGALTRLRPGADQAQTRHRPGTGEALARLDLAERCQATRKTWHTTTFCSPGLFLRGPTFGPADLAGPARPAPPTPQIPQTPATPTRKRPTPGEPGMGRFGEAGRLNQPAAVRTTGANRGHRTTTGEPAAAPEAEASV